MIGFHQEESFHPPGASRLGGHTTIYHGRNSTYGTKHEYPVIYAWIIRCIEPRPRLINRDSLLGRLAVRHRRSLKDKIRNLSSNPTTPPKNIWSHDFCQCESPFVFCSVCFTVSSYRLDRIPDTLAPKSSYSTWRTSMRPRRRTTPLTYVCSPPRKTCRRDSGSFSGRRLWSIAVINTSLPPECRPWFRCFCQAIMGAGLRRPAATCE